MRDKDKFKGTDVNSCHASIGRSKMVEEVDKFENERRATKAVVPRERVWVCVPKRRKRKETGGGE